MKTFPIYDDNYNYVNFIEHWKDSLNGDEHYIVYYPDRVDEYKNRDLIKSSINLTGLPIHYVGLEKSAYNHFGDCFPNDLIPIMDQIEHILSKMNDSIRACL